MEGVAQRELGCCHGYHVTATEGEVGTVETPMFATPTLNPDFLLVRTTEALVGTFRIVPVGLVVDVDRANRLITIDATKAHLRHLPERPPERRI